VRWRGGSAGSARRSTSGAADVLELEVVGARRSVDDRVREDRQGRVEGRDDARERVLRVDEEALEGIDAFVERALPSLLRWSIRAGEVVLERLALA
jgi:hypothetical protein